MWINMTLSGSPPPLMMLYVNEFFKNVLVIEALKNKKKLANRFPGIHGIAHKDYFVRCMKMGNDIDEDMFNTFVPRQYVFPIDRDIFVETYKKKNNNNIYIAKPVASSQGDSILLFKE